LIEVVQTGEIDPAGVLTEYEARGSAVNAYKTFDQRQPGWIKVELDPAVTAHM
jgi:threonine dehydrogenase-like Zn-dependent dehydrogenase